MSSPARHICRPPHDTGVVQTIPILTRPVLTRPNKKPSAPGELARVDILDVMTDFFAQEMVDAFVPVYQNGLRDVRNRSLAPYWTLTPRSLPTDEDFEERYASIQEAASESDNTTPMPVSEWASLFPPAEGQRIFIEMLLRHGLERTLVDDLETEEVDQLALRSAELVDLSIQQQVRGERFSISYIQDVLARSEGLEGLDVVETLHFIEDEQENDAYDADRKALQRISQMMQYITDLLGELS